MTHGFPVHRFRRSVAAGIFQKDLVVQLFRIRPFLLDKGNAREPQKQLRGKFVFGQIAFNAVALFAIFVQYQNGGSPD
jgi:hypothetical protein